MESRRGAWNPFTRKPMEYIPQKKIRCRFSKKIKEVVNKVDINNSKKERNGRTMVNDR